MASFISLVGLFFRSLSIVIMPALKYLSGILYLVVLAGVSAACFFSGVQVLLSYIFAHHNFFF